MLTERRSETRDRIMSAMELVVSRGVKPTVCTVARASGLSRGTVWSHRDLLNAHYGEAPGSHLDCLGPRDKEEIEDRIAVVRAAKVRHAVLGGLDAKVLSEILSD